MNNEQKAAYINAQSACAMAEIAAYQAENDQRKALGQSMPYTEDAFLAIPDKYGIGHNAVVSFFGE